MISFRELAVTYTVAFSLQFCSNLKHRVQPRKVLLRDAVKHFRYMYFHCLAMLGTHLKEPVFNL